MVTITADRGYGQGKSKTIKCTDETTLYDLASQLINAFKLDNDDTHGCRFSMPHDRRIKRDKQRGWPGHTVDQAFDFSFFPCYAFEEDFDSTDLYHDKAAPGLTIASLVSAGDELWFEHDFGSTVAISLRVKQIK